MRSAVAFTALVGVAATAALAAPLRVIVPNVHTRDDFSSLTVRDVIETIPYSNELEKRGGGYNNLRGGKPPGQRDWNMKPGQERAIAPKLPPYKSTAVTGTPQNIQPDPNHPAFRNGVYVPGQNGQPATHRGFGG
ncbi:hypothetical protein EIP91_010993 [Steccherinum ochraceum]|uniref:Uncharacterized protein n=1 Tax=Steccherinum ochraceum TaxID=92696 RepID=A0A4R0RQ93_9APHY|nr:hypothetical protein EIP91_010993 [Steccherinum ochraceum]